MILLLAAFPAALLLVWGFWRWDRDGQPKLLAVLRGKGRAGYFAIIVSFLLLALALAPLGVSAVEISN